VVERDVFIRALKTLLVFLPRDSRRVQLLVKPSASEISLTVAGGDSGAGDVSIPFEGDGEDLEIVFNIQYLLDGLQHIPGDKVKTKFVGTSDPVVFLPDDTAQHYTYVVMPIQAQ